MSQSALAQDPVKYVSKLRLSTNVTEQDNMKNLWRATDAVQSILLGHIMAERQFFEKVQAEILTPIGKLYREKS